MTASFMRHRRRHTRQPEPELGSDHEHLQLRPERRRRKVSAFDQSLQLAQARSAGIAALASLMTPDLRAADQPANANGGLPDLPHFPPKAKRVIYLFQSGAPSQMELFDYKPKLSDYRGAELPDSIRGGQRLTGMTAYQTTFPTAPSMFRFDQHGKSGAWLSELLPHTGKVADELSIIRSLQTEAINHDPAVTYLKSRREKMNDEMTRSIAM